MQVQVEIISSHMGEQTDRPPRIAGIWEKQSKHGQKVQVDFEGRKHERENKKIDGATFCTDRQTMKLFFEFSLIFDRFPKSKHSIIRTSPGT